MLKTNSDYMPDLSHILITGITRPGQIVIIFQTSQKNNQSKNQNQINFKSLRLKSDYFYAR